MIPISDAGYDNVQIDVSSVMARQELLGLRARALEDLVPF
jgi:hypothetical protein